MRGTILATVFAATLGACYTEGTVGYGATYSSGYGTNAEVYATTPDLVTVSPGVQVVADYDEPVFYTDGFYWRFDNGLWYRSNNYATGWYYWDRPPVTVLRIDRPYAYRHYRPTGYVARNRPRYRPPEVVRDHRAPAYRGAEPVVRERRDFRQAPPARAPSNAPVVRERPAAPAARAPSNPPPAAVRDHRAPPPAKETKDSRVRDHRD